MSAHAWEIETVDGGHIGSGDFWICHACGASGGPVRVDPNGKIAYGPPTWPPFLAGGSPAMHFDVVDCDEAAAQLREYVLRELRKLPKSMAMQRNLLGQAVVWTPDKKNVTLVWQICMDLRLCSPTMPKLAEIAVRLKDAGFVITDPDVAKRR